MYKVFVNEKKLTISKSESNVDKNLRFEDTTTLEMALDFLENTSCPQINIYESDIDLIWNKFTSFFKVIKAAGGVVKNNDGKILFIHRLGKWDLPKGKIEKGESLEEAAVREVEEETALNDLQIINFINSTYHIYTERKGTKVLKITYWFNMNYLGDKMPVPQVEEGITEVDWKNVEDINAVVLPNTFKNIQLILSEAEVF